MISILIPAYNYNCSGLIEELVNQASQSGIPYEMIVMEDGSTVHLSENAQICSQYKLTYQVLTKNIGRSAIRNKLADMARYQWLLFLDCDSRLPHPDFIQRYHKAIQYLNSSVICGGRVFGEKESFSSEFSLHWQCGTQKEPKANELKKNNNKPFLSNNFLIKKEIFKSIRFEEALKGYGHEDTLFGLQLKKKGIQICYIQNPVFHEGLDSNDLFLKKTRDSIYNLKILNEKFLLPDDYKQIRILNYYHRIQQLHLAPIGAIFYDQTHRYIEKQLKGEKPNLLLFDMYKLGFLCKVMTADPLQSHKTDL